MSTRSIRPLESDLRSGVSGEAGAAQVVKLWLKNIALSVVSLLVFYLVIELIVFPLALMSIPIGHQAFLLKPVRVLAQDSKQGLVPRNYIAIVGDSYAQGAGGFRYDPETKTETHLATHHFLHQLTGRDVVTFGQAGASSLSGVAKFFEQFSRLRSTGRFRFQDPDVILLFFYEGNDAHDNLEVITSNCRDQLDQGRHEVVSCQASVRQTVRRDLDDALASYNASNLGGLRSNLLFFDFIKSILHHQRMLWRVEGGRDEPAPRKPLTWKDREKLETKWKHPEVRAKFKERRRLRRELSKLENKVRLNGEIVAISRRRSQAPPTEFTEEELELALFVFEASLDELLRQFPSSKTLVVYIPSPLTSYEVVSPQVYTERDEGLCDTEAMIKRGELTFKTIQSIVAARNLPLIDARAAIKSHAKTMRLHGHSPNQNQLSDHFNSDGYEVLANAIVPYLANDVELR